MCWKDIGQKEYVHEQSGGHAVRGESVSRHLLHGHTAPAPSANIRFLTFCPFLTAAQALQWREPQEFKVRALVRQRLAHLGTAVGGLYVKFCTPSCTRKENICLRTMHLGTSISGKVCSPWKSFLNSHKKETQPKCLNHQSSSPTSLESLATPATHKLHHHVAPSLAWACMCSSMQPLCGYDGRADAPCGLWVHQ